MPQSVLTEPLARPIPIPAWEIFNRQITAALPNSDGHNNPGRPESLTIRFSRAADLEKVVDLYSGHRKSIIDPHHFVRPRSFEELAGPVRSGAAALAIDENGEIRASALASVYHDGNGGKKNITEIGAVMCDVGGIGLSKAVLAMLALKQTFDPRAGERVFAKVARDNAASNKVFASSLGWDQVRCPRESATLYDVAYRSHRGEGKRDRFWYHFNGAAKEKASSILQGCVDQEVLQAKDGSVVRLNIESSSLWSTLHFSNMLSLS